MKNAVLINQSSVISHQFVTVHQSPITVLFISSSSCTLLIRSLATKTCDTHLGDHSGTVRASDGGNVSSTLLVSSVGSSLLDHLS